MRKSLVLAGLLFALPLFASGVSNDEADLEIHQELRSVLSTVEGAINSGNYDAMLPVISNDIRATTITQEVMSTRPEVSGYFKKWFGKGGFLKKLDMHFNADALTELSADKTWGIVRGSGIENYTLSDGRFYPMKTRWTAVLRKEADGRWRLRAIHIGTNFLDNPILDDAKRAVAHYSIIAALAGLLIGLGSGFFLARKQRAARG
jgi:ketosteroid isomerase-like protein